jgi:hypothetical protein
MPLVYMNSFAEGGQLTPIFKWAPGSQEDFLDYIAPNSQIKDPTFDFTDKGLPRLIFEVLSVKLVDFGHGLLVEQLDFNGEKRSIVMENDQLYSWIIDTPVEDPRVGMISIPGVWDPEGWWFCDQYGRPYNINDIVAFPPSQETP